jgi:UDP-3-O-[3-hydroxymyristoyl] glucosamine N-acyltransferase
MKTLTLSTLQEQFPELISDRIGGDTEVSGFASCESYQQGDLIFCEDKSFLKNLDDPEPTAIVTTAELAKSIGNNKIGILIASDVKLAQAFIRQRYDDVDLHNSEWPGIHQTAVIHDSVSVPDSASIGPGAVIGRNVKIGERVVVQANTVVEEGALINDDSVLHARVFIGRYCSIGKRVRLKPGCVIGAEGFGFARDQNQHFHRIPQKGIVVIEDDVVVSANSTIDRAAFDETRIARGTKIDALCHIAHNVFIDQDCVLVAQTGIAGSSKFGKRVLASGQTGVIDHITIGDDVVLVHRAGIPEDILEPGMYAGGPAQPFREYRRNISVFKKLSNLRQRLMQLEKQVKKLTGGQGKSPDKSRLTGKNFD